MIMQHVKDLECLFGLDALGKIKILSTVSHRQSSGASLCPKLTNPIVFLLLPPRTPLVPHVLATPLQPPNQEQQHKAPSDPDMRWRNLPRFQLTKLKVESRKLRQESLD
ncbi:hypothetical protein TNCV_1527651 [Trichonephila clavipes]|nr:hypothetical protein TNCV_1527651 [Trichonephila clavipes]